MSNKNINIGFAGLSHLGLTTSIAITKFSNLRVTAFDSNKKLINNISKFHTINLKEPNLSSHLKKYKNKIKFTYDPNDLKKCDIVYIAKDTETNKKNEANIQALKKFIISVTKFINKSAILVIHSQIPLNFMEKINWPKNRLFYHVETLVFGEALFRVLKPERLIIGCNNDKNKLPKLFQTYLSMFNSNIICMNYQSAELTKISINLFLISSLSTTNKLTQICENTDANWSKIREAIILDKRIGKFSYTKPGLGLSGGNLERDLRAIIKVNNKLNIDNKYFNSIEQISVIRKKWILNQLKNLGYKDNKNLKLALLGISYKSNTNSIKNSPALEILNNFKRSEIKYYDPFISEILTKKHHKRVKNIKDVFNDANLLIIANDWYRYESIGLSQLKKLKDKIVIDPFNLLRNINFNKYGINHIILGNVN